jgi:hypothetical protein
LYWIHYWINHFKYLNVLERNSSMFSKIQPRISAEIGMGSAVLWLIALLIEYSFHLQPPGNGSLLYYLDQALFFIAMAGYVILLVGLWQARTAGDGLFGKISLGIFITGLVALLIAQIVQLLTNNADFFLFPIGGLCQLLGGLLAGIAVAVSKRWESWQRFAPLLQGLYYLIALMLPIIITNQEPTLLTESIWQVTWFITSLALFTKTRDVLFGRRATA